MAERYLDADGDGNPDVSGDPGLDSTPVVGKTQDARNRALRTFTQGLVSDLLGVIVLFLLPIFGNDSFDWGTTDWKALGLLLAKTVVVTVISYVARMRGISPATTTV